MPTSAIWWYCHVPRHGQQDAGESLLWLPALKIKIKRRDSGLAAPFWCCLPSSPCGWTSRTVSHFISLQQCFWQMLFLTKPNLCRKTNIRQHWHGFVFCFNFLICFVPVLWTQDLETATVRATTVGWTSILEVVLCSWRLIEHLCLIIIPIRHLVTGSPSSSQKPPPTLERKMTQSGFWVYAFELLNVRPV